MKLRGWQKEAVSAVVRKFEKPFTHFLCLATPGAGKTVMASVVADRMLKSDKVDLVLCFSPSSIVAEDFKVELEATTNKRFCGGLGAKGKSLTYQSMRYIEEELRDLLKSYRVLAIFDEIHHCAGQDGTSANAWGEYIVRNIQGKAYYTLALTGTPWRSDTIPISLAQYVGEDKKIFVDYSYDLKMAISDGVCRVPHITVLDNESITVTSYKEQKAFASIDEFIKSKMLPYLTLINENNVIKQILKCGTHRLDLEREKYPDAGGLIVASSISHAFVIQEILLKSGEASKIVTYQEDSPNLLIHQFKYGTDKWIISIGMISEGTNIPRLRVCCYLSKVTTELYFRQVIGRVLRIQNHENERGYFITPAHPSLIQFAMKMAQEIPHYAELKIGSSREQKLKNTFLRNNVLSETPSKPSSTRDVEFYSKNDVDGPNDTYLSTPQSYKINTLGRFRQAVYEL